MTTTTPTPALAPNHHAHHPGFSGVRGVLFGALFAAGRSRTAGLAAHMTAVGPADSILDIGCGSGPAVRAAARRGAHGIGIDPSPEMLRVARWLTRARRRIDYRLGTAERLPVADGEATVAWSISSVHHWQDVDAGAAELARALAPSGRMVAMERETADGADGLASHGWTLAQGEAFAAVCRTAGFEEVRVERIAGDARRHHHRAGAHRRGGWIAVRATKPS